jgi:hypothetical protein
MPLALELVQPGSRFAGRKAVLFVACPICPRMHVQHRAGEPLYSWRTVLGAKDAFDRHMISLVQGVRASGASADWHRTSGLLPACLWTEADGRKLRDRARAFDAVGVVGCESAVATVARFVSGKPVVQLAKVTGIANLTLRSRFPLRCEIVAGETIPLPAPDA